MEEKVLVKGIFGGKFMVALLWILSIAAITILFVCGIIDTADNRRGNGIVFLNKSHTVFRVFEITVTEGA
jgi:hypothetical protein